MLVIRRRFTATALIGLAAIVLASPAPGQTTNPNFRIPGALPGGQQAQATAVIGQAQPTTPSYVNPYTVPYGQGPTIVPNVYGGTATITSSPYGTTQTASSPYSSPYYGGGAYGNPYSSPVYEPFGGYLRGVADVTQANAQYQVTIQQARLSQAQADMARIDVRRRLFDEAIYERNMTPTPEQVRLHELNAALNRARRSPPLTEIWSGKALNDLYLHLANQLGKGNRGPDVPVDEDMLKRINLTTGVGGSIGVLKDDGKLLWPLPLQTADFQAERKRMERNAADMVQNLKFGNTPEVATLKEMLADLNRLNETLAKGVGDLSPSQFIEARRYLNQLDDALKALQDPNVVNFFTKKWIAEGRKVAELVKNMSDKGLRFAAAAPGDEPAYSVLYQALNAFDAGMAPKLTTDK